MNCHDFDALWCSDNHADRDQVIRHAQGCEACAEQLWFELQLEAATRAIRPKAPDLFEAIYSTYRRQQADRLQPPTRTQFPNKNLIGQISPWNKVRWLVPFAAGLLIAVSLFRAFDRESPAESVNSEVLLSQHDLEQSILLERNLRDDQRDLVQKIRPTRAPAVPAAPLAEEAQFLDTAIEECERALEENQRNRHLRQQLLDLTQRRNAILTRLVEGV